MTALPWFPDGNGGLRSRLGSVLLHIIQRRMGVAYELRVGGRKVGTFVSLDFAKAEAQRLAAGPLLRGA